ncbi:DNA cytosine methyltransferase [Corynebacterium striatum]
MKIGSMFSGYGGLDYAIEQMTGAKPSWFVEFDKAPSKILAHNYPGVPNFGDVTRVDWGEVEPVNILTGGYPCQPFSMAGKRKGENDERHLWPYVRKAISSLQPDLTVLENVSGHRSLGFSRVLGDMAEDGLHARWVSVRASDVGAPHHRERLFIAVTHPSGKRLKAKQLSLRQAQEITWDNDMFDFLAGLNGAVDIDHELRMQFEDYGPAILTWALITGTAPPPVVVEQVSYLHKDLFGTRFPEFRTATNPEFIEWMMGLPAGWVTDVPGVARTAQIKALGNGVCPPQAVYALQLLDVFDLE